MIRALGPGSVSSFLKVILDVFYFVLLAVLAVLALAVLALLLVSFDPQLLPQSVLLRGHILTKGAGVAALMVTGGALSLVGVLVIVQRLRRVFGAMTAGDPFHPDNVRRLRTIALVFALVEVNDYLFGFVGHFLMGDREPSLDLTSWFAVLVLVVLAEVFREGARLRRDAELTI